MQMAKISGTLFTVVILVLNQNTFKNRRFNNPVMCLSGLTNFKFNQLGIACKNCDHFVRSRKSKKDSLLLGQQRCTTANKLPKKTHGDQC